MMILILFYSVRMFKNIRENMYKTIWAQELLAIFNILNEDIIKAIDIKTDGDKIILKGFLFSFSDEENDKDWGIILNCSENVARIYNLNPQKFIWELGENKTLKLYKIYEKNKISKDIYEVNLSACPSTDSLCFSDVYEIHWYSEKGKIYRESFRNSGDKIHHSKFFVSKGEILVLDGKVILENRGFKISFRLH